MNAEYNAAKTLLDRGIKVPVTAPLWLRVFGKRTVTMTVRQPYLGTLYRISMLYLSMNITDEQLENIGDENPSNLFISHGRKLAGIAAQAILNGKWAGKLFGGVLTRYLYWKLSPIALLTIARTLVSLSGTEAFTNTIKLARSMKMTAPTLSQKTQGS